MGSSEKVAKSFYLGNNSGNKRAVTVPKKAILQLHLWTQKFYKDSKVIIQGKEKKISSNSSLSLGQIPNSLT